MVALASLCAASGLQSGIKKALGLLWKPAISLPPAPHSISLILCRPFLTDLNQQTHPHLEGS